MGERERKIERDGINIIYNNNTNDSAGPLSRVGFEVAPTIDVFATESCCRGAPPTGEGGGEEI